MPDSPPVEYRPIGPRRRRVWRGAAWLLILIAVAAALLVVPGKWREFRRERWESGERARVLAAVLNDAPPAGTVAFEEEDSRAMALSKLPDYAIFSHPLTERSGARRRLLELAKIDPRLDDVDGHPTPRQHSILFCHQLQAPTGQVRLVVVEGVVNWESGSPGQTHLLPVATTFTVDAASPAPLHPTSESEGPLIDGSMSETEPTWALRVFAGQLDAKDASHFSIDYQTSSGSKGTVDGWLRQSSGEKGMTDKVEMKLR